MLHFRTILLWLAFIGLVLQYFIDIQINITAAIVFRLAPSALLILWFILSVLFKEHLKIRPEDTPALVLKLMGLLRPLASICVVLGALFKLSGLLNGNFMLLSGIGLMALYSTLLSLYAYDHSVQRDDIIDQTED